MPPIPKTRREELESHDRRKIHLALGNEPDFVMWVNAKYEGPLAEGGYVNAGLQPDGSSDFIGILTMPVYIPSASNHQTVGRFCAFEVKRPGHIPRVEYLEELISRQARGEKLNKAQQHDVNQWLYIKLVRSRGGFATYVDSVESAKAALGRARRGEVG